MTHPLLEANAHLKGTMFTPDGWDGMRSFIENSPPFIVVEAGFTEQCGPLLEEHLPKGDRTIFNIVKNRAIPETIRNFISFIGEVAAMPHGDTSQAAGSFVLTSGGRTTHVDVDQGHSILGYFQVTPNEDGELPEFTICTKPSDEYHWYQWDDEVMVSPDDPAQFTLNSGLLVLLNGAATTTRTGKSSTLPHGVEMPLGAARTRLMVYA